jgi:hypothetical protein
LIAVVACSGRYCSAGSVLQVLADDNAMSRSP